MGTITKLGVVLASVAIWQSLFHFLNFWLSEKIFPRFNVLSLGKKRNWNSRVVSTWHALVILVLYVRSFVFDKVLTVDPNGDDLSFVTVPICIATGHLISDLLLYILYWGVIGDIVLVIQDSAALCAYSLLLFQVEGILAYAADFHLIRLLSTVFVNQLYFLDILEYPKLSEGYIISGILTAVTFFLVRIVATACFYYFIYCMHGTDEYLKLGLLFQLSWISSWVFIHITDTIRMIKIIEKLVKTFHSGGKETGNPRN